MGVYGIPKLAFGLLGGISGFLGGLAHSGPVSLCRSIASHSRRGLIPLPGSIVDRRLRDPIQRVPQAPEMGRYVGWRSGRLRALDGAAASRILFGRPLQKIVRIIGPNLPFKLAETHIASLLKGRRF
jgi:hypothetical protein